MPVQLVFLQQFAVFALPFQAGVVQQEHAVARFQRRQSVWYEDHSPIRQDAGVGIIEQFPRALVQDVVGLFNDEDRRVAQYRSRQGNSELLPDAQGVAQLSDRRFIAEREFLHEVVRVDQLGGLDDLRNGITRVAAT